MPEYTIRDPQTGKTVTVRGDSPPTEAELTEIFASAGGSPAKPAQVRSRTGQMYTPPTEGITKDVLTGAGESLNPMNILTLLKSAYNDPAATAGALVKAPVTIAGQMVTNPAKTLGALGAGMAISPLLGAAGGALKSAATPIYETGLARTAAMRRAFPTAAAEGVAQGITNPTEVNVAAKLSGVESQLKSDVAAAGARSQAGPTGWTSSTLPAQIDPAAIADEAKQLVIKRAGLVAPNQAGGGAARGNRTAALAQLDTLASRFVKENAEPLTAGGTLSLKRGQQNLANAAYRAEERGAPVNQIQTLWDEATAEVARKQLLGAVPGAEKALGTEQGLMGLKQAATRNDVPGPLVNQHTLFSAIKHLTLQNPQAMAPAGVASDRLGALLQDPKIIQALQALAASKAARPND